MTKKNKLVFFLLALLFIAPGLSAYVVYLHPEWLNQSTTNKGHFLKPARQLLAWNDDKTWRLMLWYPDTCKNACLAQLKQLTQIRLALGRRYYDVQTWLMQPDNTPTLNSRLIQGIEAHGIEHTRVSLSQINEAQLAALPTLYIVNPNQYIVLQYTLDSNPDDIFHDIKLLLTTDKARH